MDTRTKSRELKFAPAWKRVLSYIIDTVFLLLFLTLLVALVYGEDFSTLYAMVKQTGGLNLILKEGLFPESVELIRGYPKEVQDMLYIQNFVSKRYFYLIYVYFHLLTVGYFAFFWRFTGQTLGSRILGIRVINKNAYPISLWSCLLRSCLLRLFEYAYYLPSIVIVDRRLHQRVHDKLSGTIVIENKEWEDALNDLQKLLEEEENLHQDNAPKLFSRAPAPGGAPLDYLPFPKRLRAA